MTTASMTNGHAAIPLNGHLPIPLDDAEPPPTTPYDRALAELKAGTTEARLEKILNNFPSLRDFVRCATCGKPWKTEHTADCLRHAYRPCA